MTNKRLQQLMQFREDEPDDPFLKYGIALEFISMKEPESAVPWFEDLATKHPNYVPTYYQFGKLLWELGKLNESRTIFEKGIVVAEAAGNKHAAAELREIMEDLE